MGSWRKRGNNSYQLTVCQGYDNLGKKLIKNKTITLSENLTEKICKNILQETEELLCWIKEKL